MLLSPPTTLDDATRANPRESNVLMSRAFLSHCGAAGVRNLKAHRPFSGVPKHSGRTCLPDSRLFCCDINLASRSSKGPRGRRDGSRIAFATSSEDDQVMKRTFFVLSALLTVSIVLTSTAKAQSARSGDEVPSPLDELAGQLSSKEFETRLKAARRLQELKVAQLDRLLTQTTGTDSSVRILRELKQRYVKQALPSPGRPFKPSEQTQQASSVLERLANASVLLHADQARSVLEGEWHRRALLVCPELKNKGAKIVYGTWSQTSIAIGAPSSAPAIQILIGEDWKGTTEDLRLLDRMKRLAGPDMIRRGVSVWVLEGHSLTNKDLSVMYEYLGTQRVQERSRVALGITWNNLSPGPGVMIDRCTPRASAAEAGLRKGDRILAIIEPIPEDLGPKERREAEEAQELIDFDDLITRLKKYRAGDEMTLRVERQFDPEIKEIKVKLKGWEDTPAYP